MILLGAIWDTLREGFYGLVDSVGFFGRLSIIAVILLVYTGSITVGAVLTVVFAVFTTVQLRIQREEKAEAEVHRQRMEEIGREWRIIETEDDDVIDDPNVSAGLDADPRLNSPARLRAQNWRQHLADAQQEWEAREKEKIRRQNERAWELRRSRDKALEEGRPDDPAVYGPSRDVTDSPED